ncbi:5298_t:CDS:2, partial [Dentiscutata erythropus]
TPDKKDELIEILVKQVQQLSVNYVTAHNQQEKDTREREKYRENPKPRRETVCYRCGEKGHIARFCMSEKRPKEPSEVERPPRKALVEAYRAAPSEHEFIEKELKEMEERGLIR